MTRKLRFYNLKKPKLRQSWNKINLYNMARLGLMRSPINNSMTYYQQKWKSKSITRAYHGQKMPEHHWHRIFRPSINSVVAIPPSLGRTDGAEYAAGRGSGLKGKEEEKSSARMPYMNMVYAPMERRLDIAIFRALFASSARQARQFVTSGYVKVNGKKMIYPGYMLNPGDMFQVEPERVLYATGAPKDAHQRHKAKAIRKRVAAAETAEETANEDEASEALTEAPKPQSAHSSPNPNVPPSNDEAATDETGAEDATSPKDTLAAFLTSAKLTLTNETDASAQRKRDLRDFVRQVRAHLSRAQRATSVDEQLLALANKFSVPLTTSSADPNASDAPSATSAAVPAAPPDRLKAYLDTLFPGRAGPQDAAPRTFATDALRTLHAALAEARDNPVDARKPYATPWRPRDWMAAFAFVPRYLEVHHRVCAAVYLRHPVARAGWGEVPTPYGEEVNGLAYNWYLRRR